MTERIKENKLPKFILLFIILFTSVLFTVYSDNISDYAMNALKLCVFSVIPSLFPFMVLSALASKAASFLTAGNSPVAAIVLSFFLGALCGFPIGAASVAAMHKNGALKKDLSEGLCALCNNTGPAFVIGVIGRNFWKSTSLGIMFYFCQLSAAIFVFGIWRLFFGRCKTHCSSALVKNNFLCTHRHANANTASAAEQFASIFCSSVGDSVISLLQICGYIVFFKVLCDTIRFFLPHQPLYDLLYTAVTSILEFTTGASTAAKLGGTAGIAFCGFTIGFSGLSVIGQSSGILSRAGLSVKPLLTMKIFVGILSAVLSVSAYSLFDFSKSVSLVGYTGIPFAMFCISGAIIALSAIFRLFLLMLHRRA